MFAADFIRGRTKKNQTAPEHPFFAAARDLLAAHAASAGESLPVGAHTPEAQANVITGGVGDLLAHLATALLDQRIDAREAEGLLPRVRGLRASLKSFERHCVAILAGRPS
mgnify:CR=1 FL=1